MYLASMTRSHWSLYLYKYKHFLIDFTSEWNEISVFSKKFKGFGRKNTFTNNFKQDMKSNQISTLF